MYVCAYIVLQNVKCTYIVLKYLIIWTPDFIESAQLLFSKDASGISYATMY